MAYEALLNIPGHGQAFWSVNANLYFEVSELRVIKVKGALREVTRVNWSGKFVFDSVSNQAS